MAYAPDFLALVFFEEYGGDNKWKPVEGGSRIDIRKEAFLDALTANGIGNGELSELFGHEVARIARVAMAQPIVIFRQEGQK